MQKILKYWKDPVLSKVFAVTIITILSIAYKFLTPYRSVISSKCMAICHSRIKLWVILVILSLLFMFYYIYRWYGS